MYTAKVTLGDTLSRLGVTAYRLQKEGRGVVSRNAVYALARGDADRVDLGTLEKLANLLEQMTGHPVTLADIVTLERDSLPLPA